MGAPRQDGRAPEHAAAGLRRGLRRRAGRASLRRGLRTRRPAAPRLRPDLDRGARPGRRHQHRGALRHAVAAAAARDPRRLRGVEPDRRPDPDPALRRLGRGGGDRARDDRRGPRVGARHPPPDRGVLPARLRAQGARGVRPGDPARRPPAAPPGAARARRGGDDRRRGKSAGPAAAAPVRRR